MWKRSIPDAFVGVGRIRGVAPAKLFNSRIAGRLVPYALSGKSLGPGLRRDDGSC